jgi:uncharacterized membrane protein
MTMLAGGGEKDQEISEDSRHQGRDLKPGPTKYNINTAASIIITIVVVVVIIIITIILIITIIVIITITTTTTIIIIIVIWNEKFKASNSINAVRSRKINKR